MQQLLEKALQPSYLKIIDDSDEHIGHAGAAGGAGHYTVEISSAHFTGKNTLACHRMVYAAVANMIPTEIHALRIKIV